MNLPPRDLEVLKRAASESVVLVPGGDPWLAVSCVALMSRGLVSVGPAGPSRAVSVTGLGLEYLAEFELAELFGAP